MLKRIYKKIYYWLVFNFKINSWYDVEYFIEKFKRIPNEAIGYAKPENGCVMYWVGMKDYRHKSITVEGRVLSDIFVNVYPILEPFPINQRLWEVNDFLDFGEGDPKDRIMKALRTAEQMNLK